MFPEESKELDSNPRSISSRDAQRFPPSISNTPIPERFTSLVVNCTIHGATRDRKGRIRGLAVQRVDVAPIAAPGLKKPMFSRG